MESPTRDLSRFGKGKHFGLRNAQAEKFTGWVPVNKEAKHVDQSEGA